MGFLQLCQCRIAPSPLWECAIYSNCKWHAMGLRETTLQEIDLSVREHLLLFRLNFPFNFISLSHLSLSLPLNGYRHFRLLYGGFFPKVGVYLKICLHCNRALWLSYRHSGASFNLSSSGNAAVKLWQSGLQHGIATWVITQVGLYSSTKVHAATTSLLWYPQ